LRALGTVVLFALLSLPLWSDAESTSAPAPGPAQVAPAQVLDRYVTAVQSQETHARPVSMDVDMDAKLPRLRKQGRFHAFRFMTRLGQILYGTPRYEGDNTIKKEVIGRFLQAEREARSEYAGSLTVTPANYRFKFKGMDDYGGRPVYVFEVSPKKKLVGLYKGELWIDQQTYLPLRHWGELVKNPSLMVRHVYFVRDYYICEGVSVPRRLISEIETRLVGRANLTIWYDNVSVGQATPITASRGAALPDAQPGGGSHQ